MITLISSTNRPHSRTRQVSNIYAEILKAKGEEVQIIDLQDIPENLLNKSFYVKTNPNEELAPIINKIVEAKKFVFLVPEYNGSFPGVLKLFIDALPFPASFSGKKAGLIGLGNGVQGAVLAMSHLTDVFSYLGMHTMAFKPKLNHLNKHLEDGQITNELFLSMLNEHADKMIGF